jgi:hypothetical protein
MRIKKRIVFEVYFLFNNYHSTYYPLETKYNHKLKVVFDGIGTKHI